MKPLPCLNHPLPVCTLVLFLLTQSAPAHAAGPVTIASVEGAQATYSPGEELVIQVRGTINGAQLPSPVDGWVLSGHVYSGPPGERSGRPSLSGYYSQGTYDNGVWTLRQPVPRTPGEYTTEIQLHCGNIYKPCESIGGYDWRHIGYHVTCPSSDCSTAPASSIRYLGSTVVPSDHPEVGENIYLKVEVQNTSSLPVYDVPVSAISNIGSGNSYAVHFQPNEQKTVSFWVIAGAAHKKLSPLQYEVKVAGKLVDTIEITVVDAKPKPTVAPPPRPRRLTAKERRLLRQQQRLLRRTGN